MDRELKRAFLSLAYVFAMVGATGMSLGKHAILDIEIRKINNQIENTRYSVYDPTPRMERLSKMYEALGITVPIVGIGGPIAGYNIIRKRRRDLSSVA